MLISYPFLHRPPLEDDPSNFGYDLSRLGELAGSGTFPISQTLFAWHGGSHWQAPALPGGGVEPVRAIADGVVIYARNSDQRPTNAEALKQHPLYYYKGWTSNGVVILKHTTEIGENVKVTFYSIYQHVDKLAKRGPVNQQKELTRGDKVYRKDPLGTAGSIYGQPNRIHLEIVAARDQLVHLTSRPNGELTAPQGRTTCVWGNMHIVVPTGVPIYERDPVRATEKYVVSDNDTKEGLCTLFHTSLAYLRKITPTINGFDNPADSDVDWFNKRSGIWQSSKELSPPTPAQRTIHVPLLYGAAVDPTPSPGQQSHQRERLPERYFAKQIGRTPTAVYVCLSESGSKITVSMRARPSDAPLQGEESSAYDLYARSQKTYPGCTSAGYEMLRFGRLLGPDQPAPLDLHMGRLPHYRKLTFTTTAGGTVEGYIDLNVKDVRVYSDADFPHWEGWTFIDDDASDTADSRCRSARLLDILAPTGTAPASTPAHDAQTPAQIQQQQAERLARAKAALETAAMRKRLRRCIVTMHTEWSSGSFDQQWAWIKGIEPNDARAMGPGTCLSEAAYTRLQRHSAALAFWEQAQTDGLELEKVHAHFHPGEFIEAFRKCGWLSADEFLQLLPTEVLNENGSTIYIEPVPLIPARKTVINNHRIPLNLSLRRYSINTPPRMAAFFGNALQETQWLEKLHENSSTYWYRPWDGRGFLQLTHPSNYLDYWDFRGRGNQIAPEVRRALLTAHKRADTDRAHSQNYIADTVSGITPLLLRWRQDVGSNDDLMRDLISPADSAGYYWLRTGMARYADRATQLERRVVVAYKRPDKKHPNAPNPPINKVYYHSANFRDASAAVNLPEAVENPSQAFNGYIARCIPFAQAVAVLDDILFPGPLGLVTLMFPEGRTPRRP